MSTLPLPVRVAAGLIVTAVEQVRELPRLVTELPITAVSQALQASMRAQQRVTELAIKGDRALSLLRPVPDTPEWAVFDDELDEKPSANGSPVTPAGRRMTFDDETSEPASPEEFDEAFGAGVPDEPGYAEPEPQPSPRPPAVAAEEAPAVMPEYPRISLPQLRGKLRSLSLADLHALLMWETSHGNRPPYVTMLSNRITAVNEA